jgi:hypothetical protein
VFRVEKAFRLDVQDTFANADREAAYYRLVEVTPNHPTWLIDVTRLGSSNSTLQQRHKFLAHDIRAAVEVLSLNTWSSRALYVLTPTQALPQDVQFTFGRCKRIWTAQDPDDSQPWWKVECGNERLLIGGQKLPSIDADWATVWTDPVIKDI